MEDEAHLIPVKAEILRSKPYASRISQYLFDTLTRADGGTFRSVVEELDYMEGEPLARSTRTKPATRFKGPILGMLSKFHYTTNEYMRQNVLLHWNSKDNREEKRRLTELFNTTAKTYSSLAEAWEVAGKIAGQVVGGYGLRGDSQKLTGEWVIFREWEGDNYYLGLGVHAELSDEQGLFDRVKEGCPEFPFCFLENLTEKSE